MRLSEIKGERVFDVIADITEPICNIVADESAARIFARGDKPDGMDATAFTISKIRESIPSLVRTHKDDLIAILSTIEGVSADEYRENVTMPTLIKSIYDVLTDEDLISFLS